MITGSIRWRRPLAAAGLIAAAGFTPATTLPARTATDVCGAVSAGTTWTRAGSPYQTTCDVSVPADVTLTIEPGVEVRLGANHAVNVDGTLRAVGTADLPIRFAPSGTQPWAGIQLKAASGDSEIAHAVFTGGGGTRKLEMLGIATGRAQVRDSEFIDSAGIALEVKDGASPTIRDSRFVRASANTANPPAALRIRGRSEAVIENCYFASNDQVGLFWDADASPRLTGNRFEFNALDGVMVYGTVTHDVVLKSLGPRRWAYRIARGGYTIEAGGKVTISPGATIKFGPGLGMRVRGTLAVRGAAGSKVRFTSDLPRPSPGQWREIEFEPGSQPWDAATGSGSIIDHAEIEYGGSTPNGPVLIRNSAPRISNSIIRHSGKRGMTILGPESRPQLVGNLFDSNLADVSGAAVFVSGEATPDFAYNIFRNNFEGLRVEAAGRPRVGPHNWFDYNRSYGMVNTDVNTCVDATGNDWGDPIGPRDPSDSPDACGVGSTPGSGELVSDNIRYDPFEGQLVRPALTAPRCGTSSDPRPVIAGYAAPGAAVRLYDNYALLGETTAPESGGDVAEFRYTPPDPLAAGSHVIQVLSEFRGALSGITNPVEFTVDAELVIDPARMFISHTLDGTRFVQPFQDESGCLTLRGDAEWNIRLHPGSPLTLSVPIRCPGGGAPSGEIDYRGQTIPLKAPAPGDDLHTATFEMEDGGNLRLHAMCGATATDLLVGTVTRELNGFVYNAAGMPDPLLSRVGGAKVTLFVRDLALPPGQQWVLWPAARHFGQTNPQVTGPLGWYAFYPPPGQYRVMAESPGYDSTILTNEKVTIEPIVVNVGLNPRGGASPTPTGTGGGRAIHLPWLANRP